MSLPKALRFSNHEQFIAYLQDAWGVNAGSAKVAFPGEIHFQSTSDQIIQLVTKLNQELGFTLIQLLANDEQERSGEFKLYYTFACDLDKFVVVVELPLGKGEWAFPSITPLVPAANWYEREIRDLFGLEPLGHPDLRRLVQHQDWPKGTYTMHRNFQLTTPVPRVPGEFTFQRVEGEGVIQIPVGPIHAGIIEPGHFRFSAVGENVINLEARLFYTHRGMEKLSQGTTPQRGLLIAERICGACSLSHSTAYCQALEKLAAVVVPERAKFIRTIGLELERLYNHIGDVGNICAGVGFAFGTMHGARLKEEIMRLNERVFGSRFLRGINTPGGVRRDISESSRQLIIAILARVAKEFTELTKILLSNDSYLDRVEGTGKLPLQLALDLHAVGPAARASGINRDVRRDHPYAAYNQVIFGVPVYDQGDVLARVKVRIDEVFEAMDIIQQALELMPLGELRTAITKIPAYAYALGITESARGENVHFVMSGAEGTIYRHMVRSASYCNWAVVPSTVPGNIVPDFPLINKSFELCYSCLDR